MKLCKWFPFQPANKTNHISIADIQISFNFHSLASQILKVFICSNYHMLPNCFMTRPLLVGVCAYNITQIQDKRQPAELHVQDHTRRNLIFLCPLLEKCRPRIQRLTKILPYVQVQTRAYYKLVLRSVSACHHFELWHQKQQHKRGRWDILYTFENSVCDTCRLQTVDFFTKILYSISITNS